MRRASRSRPAAFCARAPADTSPIVIGRASAPAAWRAARAARSICSGVRRNAIVAAAGSNPSGASPSSDPSHSSWRRSTPGTGASTMSGGSRDHAGSQSRPPTRITGPACSAKARTAAGPRSTSGSTGPTTRPAPRSRASRDAAAASWTGSSPADIRPRSSAIAGRPPRASAVQPSDRPDAPARSRTYTSVRPAARPRATTSASSTSTAIDDASNASTIGSGRSSPSRWAVTRSGTRSGRVSDGRSASSTISRRPATSGASGPRRSRIGAPSAAVVAPHSSIARPTLARRRETSSWR